MTPLVKNKIKRKERITIGESSKPAAAIHSTKNLSTPKDSETSSVFIDSLPATWMRGMNMAKPNPSKNPVIRLRISKTKTLFPKKE